VVGDDIVFGYFGAIAPHTGVMPMLESFLAAQIPNRLRLLRIRQSLARGQYAGATESPVGIRGFAAPTRAIVSLSASRAMFLSSPPARWGNENNFPSKLFQYALTGRAILSSRLSGAELVLGQEAFYFDETDFDATLRGAVAEIAALPRAELRRRGIALSERITGQFSWAQQAASMATFIKRIP